MYTKGLIIKVLVAEIYLYIKTGECIKTRIYPGLREISGLTEPKSQPELLFSRKNAMPRKEELGVRS